MIKTTNLDKFFNKGKDNSIHVINNTSISFPEKGLVSLVGQSGSGKTTLLNVISGLDSANGTIEFNNHEMNHYESKTWDKIRSHDIGYVFQNYHLLDDKTVFENIALTLNMIGILDEEEVEFRVNYVLKAVDMFRFRKRKTSDLSGGQKQRVAIARAIAKNPKVLIADEPTGNLDNMNSIEVMKIIKKISEERLVVLVTHNLNLASKYSDRIVVLADGVVVDDEVNISSDEAEVVFDDHNIYLGNLNNHSNQDNIEVYSSNEINDIDVTIVKINDTYYLQSNDQNIRVNVITPSSNISIIDSKREHIDQNDVFETNFSLDDLDSIESVRVKKRTLSFKESVISAFKRMLNLRRTGKVQILALLFLGIMFATASFNLFSNIFVDQRNIHTDQHVYEVKSPLTTDYQSLSNEYTTFIDNAYAIAANFGSEVGRGLFHSTLPLEAIKESDVRLGRYPVKANEVLIDETLLDSNSKASVQFDAYGIYKPADFLGLELVYSSYSESLVVVGTVRTKSKGIYLDRFYGVSINRIDTIDIISETGVLRTRMNLIKDGDYELISGRLPNNSNFVKGNKIEVALPNNFPNVIKLGANYTYQGIDYEIVGILEENKDNLIQLTDDKGIEVFALNELTIRNVGTFYSTSKNLDSDVYTNLRAVEISTIRKDNRILAGVAIVQMLIAIGISALIFYFLVRSSFTKRVKEISILRSLGISKYEVISMFAVEYSILTLFTSFIGVLFGTYLTYMISNSFFSEFLSLRVTPLSFIVTVLVIFTTNILLALIPVVALLRKTPATMLTNYDI